MKYFVCVLMVGMLLSACSGEKGQNIATVVDDFYKCYAERQDLEQFLSYYDEHIVFEDMINGDKLEGKVALKNFLDWGNPAYKMLENKSLVLTEKIIDKNKAVVKGYFTPFQWGEHRFEAMHFTSILTFGPSQKIIMQVDWINYPNTLLNYNDRKNSNQWINN
jgi:hypothetical protein